MQILVYMFYTILTKSFVGWGLWIRSKGTEGNPTELSTQQGTKTP